jgi:putative Mn2+ efflux pump MntP
MPVLKLLAFVLPLGLDSFAVAPAIGAVQVTTSRQRLRISMVFVIFEGGMPLIGLGLGTAPARGIGKVASYLAGAAVCHKPRTCRPPARTPRNDTPRNQDQLRLSGIGS